MFQRLLTQSKLCFKGYSPNQKFILALLTNPIENRRIKTFSRRDGQPGESRAEPQQRRRPIGRRFIGQSQRSSARSDQLRGGAGPRDLDRDPQGQGRAGGEGHRGLRHPPREFGDFYLRFLDLVFYVMI